jgi:hypothetical protein
MTSTSSQFELFEGFEPQAAHAPKLALPVQSAMEIDVQRLRRILGVSDKTVHRMLESGSIRGYRVPHTQNASWRIEYTSVVEFCDQLRIRFCIADRRAGLGGIRKRYRDSELLPFPLDETIYSPQVEDQLGCSSQAVVHLIETGKLVGYQLVPDKRGSRWRIHALSLDRYIASLRPHRPNIGV